MKKPCQKLESDVICNQTQITHIHSKNSSVIECACPVCSIDVKHENVVCCITCGNFVHRLCIRNSESSLQTKDICYRCTPPFPEVDESTNKNDINISAVTLLVIARQSVNTISTMHVPIYVSCSMYNCCLVCYED